MQDKYVLKRVIGQGGMSRVYLAVDNKLHKKWAVKEIDCSGGREDYRVKALRAEASVLKRLDHKYLPRVVDAYEENGRIYLVMDYIEGESLQEKLQREGQLGQTMALHLGQQIAETLVYLHSRRPPILYRDLKPANIILREDGTICLIDFGTAHICGMGRSESFGTVGYAAPEQYKNQADARSDIYAFGVLLSYVLSGRDPAGSRVQKKRVSHWGFGKGQKLEKIIIKCTQENPDKRYQTSKEVLQALERVKLWGSNTGSHWLLSMCVACGILLMVSGIFSRQYQTAERGQETLDAYRTALEDGNNALLTGDNQAAAQAFEYAITQVDASNPEGYLCLLRLYVRKGEAEDGLMRIRGYMDSDYGGIGSSELLLCEMGRVCFYECQDYKNALYYFEQVIGETEIIYYQSLCRCLSELHIDKEFLSNTLREFYLFNQSQSDEERKIQNNFMIAKIYLTYGEELGDGLKQAGKIVMENETMVSGEESLRMLTTIYRLLGKKDDENKKYYYGKAMEYTNQLFAVPGVKEEGSLYRKKLCDMAGMYEELGENEKALQCYEMSEIKFPREGKDIYLHHLLLLMRLNRNEADIINVFEEAKQVSGMLEDRQFKKLSQKMELLYGMEGELLYE